MEQERTKITARERQAFFDMCICEKLMEEAKASLEKRGKDMPGSRRDFGVMLGAYRRLIANFTDTVPEEQLLSLKKNGERYQVQSGIVLTRHGRDDCGFWISERDAEAIRKGLGEHCLGCMKGVTEQRACELKKALDNMNMIDHKGGCEWAWELNRE